MDHGFNALDTLTNWVRGIACLIGVIVIGNIGVDLYVGYWLEQVRDHTVGDPAMLQVSLLGAQHIQRWLNACYLALLLLNAVLFCCWLHRAAGNLRALGARRLEFTPGWTVGWFFVPVANLVMPYRTVRELWLASRSPAGWDGRPVVLPVLLWWLAYVMTGFLGQIKHFMLLGAHGVADVLTASRVEMTGMVLFLLAALAFVNIVGCIGTAQAAARERQIALPLDSPAEMPA
jgi:hypothetical protein